MRQRRLPRSALTPAPRRSQVLEALEGSGAAAAAEDWRCPTTRESFWASPSFHAATAFKRTAAAADEERGEAGSDSSD